jgi:hypothetical protein
MLTSTIRWISTATRLPMRGVVVLVLVKGLPPRAGLLRWGGPLPEWATFCGDIDPDTGCLRRSHEDFTHWAMLPKNAATQS